MESYLTEFNWINRVNLLMADLFCLQCENIFTSDIYSWDEGNICEDCFRSTLPDLQNNMRVNPYLKKQLTGAEFPCKFDACDFRCKLPEFLCHINTCFYGPMVCPLDKKQFKDIGALIRHLHIHTNFEKITIESLMVSLDLKDINFAKKIVLADYKNHYFFVFIDVNGQTISFRVGKYMIPQNSSINKFGLLCSDEKITLSQEADMYCLKMLCTDMNDNGKTLRLDSSMFSENAKLMIYFSDYEKLKMNMEECSICSHTLLGAIRQCVTGHCVCAPCAAKISSCPICRQRMLTTNIKLQYLFPQCLFQCVNFDEGCVELITLADRNEHNTQCAFEPMVCPDCKCMVFPCEVYDHFIELHEYNQNFSEIQWTFKKENNYTMQETILYRSRIFFLVVRYKASNLEFLVKLLGNESSATKYRYEIIVTDKAGKVIGKVGNICSIASIEESSSTLSLSPTSEYLFEGDEWSVWCQCNICYVD